jgi:DNA-directed RNA polymerase subunit H (RpoH/RPB5)
LETLKQKEFAYDKIRLSLDEQEKALLKQLDINPLSVPSNKSEDKTLQNKWEALTGEILTAKKITQPKTDVSGPDPFAQFDQWEKLNQQIRPNQLQDQVAQGETELQRLEQMEANLLELTAHKNTLRLELEGIQQTLQQLREQEQGIPDDPTLILFIR